MAAKRSTGKSNTNRSKAKKPPVKKGGKPGALSAIMPIIFAVIAIFLLLVQINVSWTGVVGAFLRDFFSGLFGGGFYLFVPMLVIGAIFWRKDTEYHAVGIKLLFALILLVFSASLFHVVCVGQSKVGEYTVAQLYEMGAKRLSGGVVGGVFGRLLLNCGVAGAVIICAAVLLIFGMFFIGTTPMKVFGDMHYAYLERRERRERIADEMAQRPERTTQKQMEAERAEKMAQMRENHQRRRREQKETTRAARGADIDRNIYSDEEKGNPVDEARAEAEAAKRAAASETHDGTEHEISPVDVPEEPTNKWDLDEILGVKPPHADKADAEKTPEKEPLKVTTKELGEEKKPEKTAKQSEKSDNPDAYSFPPITYLQQGDGQMDFDATAELQENAEKLVKTLQSFRVNTKIINVSRGPTITRYELAPEAGTRVRSISNLVDDISLSLATGGIRIESPIPGKAAVGIEVPNKNVATVYVRELMQTEQFQKAESKLTTCLGMDVAGAPVYLDIAKMPHLLIAGATGMGKSVCINSLIVSMLYKATPDEVKLILIDPKKVELNVYNGIPQLLVPVVSDPKKAAGSLHWAVMEMERRFELIESVGVREIKAYNKITADDPEKEVMSQIVIIIDELADLMMTAPVEVEESICRLAQKARAAGMHLIIGTQRPSVDVITGLIKANIPSRIAFTVASQVDSRTILDIAGAEKLIGRGDMLFAPVGLTKPVRVQGAFVSDKEIEKITGFLKKNAGEIEYDQSVVDLIEKAAELCGGKKGKGGAPAGAEAIDGETNGDPKLKDAIDLAVQNGTISTSLLQRRLSLGYGRAAKILDAMQEKGIVSPPDGQKPRTVLISRAQWEQLQMGSSDEAVQGSADAAVDDFDESDAKTDGSEPGDGDDGVAPWEN